MELKKKILTVGICFVCLLCSCKKQTLSNENNKVSPVNTKISQNNDTTTSAKFVTTTNYYPLNYKTQKAVWFSYIDLADMLTGKTKSQFEKSISKAFENVREIGCNTIYVHVRPFGDAFYNSEIYPQTRYYTGKVTENPPFDALEIMVEQAHKNGLSIHAWINPLRCEKEKYLEQTSDSFLVKKWYNSDDFLGKYLVRVDNSEQLWMNPAYEDVRNLVCDGVAEIVENYNVDGIHIDDYFYPTSEEAFDKEAFSQSKMTDVSNFRLENTNKLVSQIYQTIKNINPDVLFGISPQGNVQNNYSQLYADVKKWAGETGYCDYIVPQIYYGFENKTQPFERVANEWNEMVCDEVTLVIGLAFYKVNEQGEFSENSGIISRQYEFSTNLTEYGGIALYNYKNIFLSENANSDVELALLQEKL